MNAAGASSVGGAELALGFIVALARVIAAGDASMRRVYDPFLATRAADAAGVPLVDLDDLLQARGLPHASRATAAGNPTSSQSSNEWRNASAVCEL